MEVTSDMLGDLPEGTLPPEVLEGFDDEFYFDSEIGTSPELMYEDALPLDGAAAAGLIGMFVVFWLVGMIMLVAVIIAWWKIFTKAGQEGWKSIIPFYNIYVMLEIVGMQPLLVLIVVGLFIPFVNIIAGIAWLVVSVMMYHKLSLAFGKGIGYTLGLIFLNPIFALMLAFGDAKYTAPVAAPTEPQPDPTPQPPQDPTPPQA